MPETKKKYMQDKQTPADSSQKKIFDICVFGASGFTGTLVAEYLAQHPDIKNIKWAIAGRNKQKLEFLRDRLQQKGFSVPETIIADVGDYQSLADMSAKSKVLITTVGPYTRYGQPVVKACIENKSDYVDLVGEPNFVDDIRYHYQQQALEARVKIINACGFDSIPHDLGVLFTVNALKEKFPEAQRKYLQIECEGYVSSNARFSGGTWHSAITAMSTLLQHRRDKLAWKKEGYQGKENMTYGRKVSRGIPGVSYKRKFSAWAMPMPTVDPEIVLRSAQLRDDYGLRFRYQHYVLLEKFWMMPALALGAMGVFILAQFWQGREWLGRVISPGEGPDEQRRAQSWFKVNFKARANDTKLCTQVSGGDPGYSETSKMLAESALCLALQREQTPARFGISTSAAAIGEVLIERLQKAGIKFEVID